MATTKPTTQPAPSPRRRARQLPQTVTGRITVDAPCGLAGADARATLLPTGGELALYLDDPEAAIEALCLRTNAPLLLSVLAFRALISDNACA